MGSMVHSMSNWFNSLGVSAEGAYYNKGTKTMMEAEDPEYLEVVDYFMGLEGKSRKPQPFNTWSNSVVHTPKLRRLMFVSGSGTSLSRETAWQHIDCTRGST
eukprot:3548428-Pyramimonas_sp.AAC.1